MENSKLENMLNLALDATPEERARSLNLGVGFDRESDAWELIVKYSGSGRNGHYGYGASE